MNQSTQKPACIGFIMDGNRRWAKARGHITLEGHRAGFEALKRVLAWAREEKIQNIIVYAFSTENWKRTEEEVGYLMGLARTVLGSEFNSLLEEDMRVRFVGDLSAFPEDLQKAMRDIEERTRHRSTHTLAIAASYGGRAEIVDAVNRAIAEGKPIDEEMFGKSLWTQDLPDPDLIVRTGGQMRLSNFLPWQSVYSEFFFLDTLWPDLTKDDLGTLLQEYTERKRNFGT